MNSDNDKNQLNNDADSDIANLNEHLETLEFADDSIIDAPAPVPMSEEEAKKTRLRLLVILAIVMICGVTMVVLLFNGFFFKTDNNVKENNNGQEEVVDDTSLTELKEGNINIKNKELLKLYNKTLYFKQGVSSNRYELLESNTLLVSASSDYTRFNLLFNSSKFIDFLKSKDNFTTICLDESSLNISTEEFKKYYVELFGDSNYTDGSFLSTIEINNTSEVYNYQVNLDSDQYTIRCNKTNNVSSTVIDKIISANKTSENITITSKIVFKSSNGIYKDTLLSNLLTSNINGSEEEYINNAYTYTFTYISKDGEYYLYKVERN